MLVELAGCSCAGKTKLGQDLIAIAAQRNLALRCAPTYPGTAAFLLIPAMYRARLRYRDVVSIAFQQIESRVFSLLVRLRLKWNVLKTLACFDIAKGLESENGIVLLDEGPINLVQTVFSVGGLPVEDSELRRFIESAPRSSIVVLVQADRAALHARRLGRNKFTLPNSTTAQNDEFFERAEAIFRLPELIDMLRARQVVHIVDTSSDDSERSIRLLTQLQAEHQAGDKRV